MVKTDRETKKKITKLALLAEEIRWKDVYAWYQEALQDMDVVSKSSSATGEEDEQTRTVLKTRTNADDDKCVEVQIPRKHPIELTMIIRTTNAADKTDNVTS